MICYCQNNPLGNYNPLSRVAALEPQLVNIKKRKMLYQITWNAVSTGLGQVSGVEEVEANSTLDALNAIRSPIIGELSESGSFAILNINFKSKNGENVTVNLQAVYQAMNSINAEGGLVKYENPPDTFTIKFGD